MIPLDPFRPRCRAIASQWLRRGAIAAAAGVLLATAVHAQTRDEYQVKAAFLYNFAKFVQWPSDAFHSPAEPIVTCVLGQDPFGKWLKEAINGKSIDGRAMVLRHIARPLDAASCQILFVSSSEPKHAWSELSEIPPSGLMTIGECADARDGGAVVNFLLEGDRVRFQINATAAERQRLRISSRLLSLARTARE